MTAPEKSRAKVSEFLMLFLPLAIMLFAIAIVIYGLASGSVQYSGTIDVRMITAIVIVTALMAILWTVFGKGNVTRI